MVRTPIRIAARFFAGFTRDRKAATAVEYGLILALIVIALIAGLTSLGGASKLTWGSVLSRISNATGY